MKLKSESGEITGNSESSAFSRRSFLSSIGIGATAFGLHQLVGCSASKQHAAAIATGGNPNVAGFEQAVDTEDIHEGWTPVSDRKVRVGLVGYGYCKFSAAFYFQYHPNVEVVAVSDLIPERCAELAKVTKCSKTYPSLEEMVKDDTIEAIFVATDPPQHARHAIEVLKHGKHVAVAVPAIFASLEEADELYETVKKSGKKYMMYETSCFREDLYAMRQIYKAGGFGKIVYVEGDYLHYGTKPAPSYNGWRDGSPPMYYLTHSTAYYVGVTDGAFTDVSCFGNPSHMPYLQGGKNRYNNPYATQVAMLNTTDGGLARMMYSKDTPGTSKEEGRVRGELGSYSRQDEYEGLKKDSLGSLNLKRPPLPPNVYSGGHGGSHGHLTEEFIRAILEDRHPVVNIAHALNMSVPGIIAHESCLRGGETMKIPQYKMW